MNDGLDAKRPYWTVSFFILGAPRGSPWQRAFCVEVTDVIEATLDTRKEANLGKVHGVNEVTFGPEGLIEATFWNDEGQPLTVEISAHSQTFRSNFFLAHGCGHLNTIYARVNQSPGTTLRVIRNGQTLAELKDIVAGTLDYAESNLTMKVATLEGGCIFVDSQAGSVGSLGDSSEGCEAGAGDSKFSIVVEDPEFFEIESTQNANFAWRLRLGGKMELVIRHVQPLKPDINLDLSFLPGVYDFRVCDEFEASAPPRCSRWVDVTAEADLVSLQSKSWGPAIRCDGSVNTYMMRGGDTRTACGGTLLLELLGEDAANQSITNLILGLESMTSQLNPFGGSDDD